MCLIFHHLKVFHAYFRVWLKGFRTEHAQANRSSNTYFKFDLDSTYQKGKILDQTTRTGEFRTKRPKQKILEIVPKKGAWIISTANVFAFVFSSASKTYCVHLSVYVFLSLFVRRALMCIYVTFCLCLCICLLTLPLSLLLSFWDKHKQSKSLPCPCLCTCLYYFAFRCLSFGDKHNCVNRPFLVFFAFFLLCLSFLDEHNCVNLPANDFPPRGMAATQCFLPSHYHPERQQKRSLGFF